MSARRLDGPGTQTVGVDREDGFVYLRFEKPVMWVKLDPGTALAVGQQLAKDSYHAKFGDEPDEKFKQLTEQVRITCKNRVALMLRSFMGRAPIPPFEIQASEIVDACLREVA